MSPYLLILLLASAGNVLDLSDDSFRHFVSKSPMLIVLFHKPDCDWCNENYNRFVLLANTFQSSQVVFGQLNASENPFKAKQYTKGLYPYIYIYEAGIELPYGNEKKCEEILRWLEGKQHQAHQLIKSEEELLKISSRTDPSLVLFYDTKDESLDRFAINLWKETNYINIYEYHANDTSSAIFKKHPLPAVAMYHRGRSPLFFDGSLGTLQPVINFAYDNSIEQCELISNVTQYILLEKGSTFMLLFTSVRNSTLEKFACDSIDAELNLKFQIVDAESSISTPLIKLFGIRKEELPVIGIIKNSRFNPIRYKDTNANEESIKQFLFNYQTENITEYVVSEGEPQENNGPLYKIVGTSFKKIVMENTKHAVILAYSSKSYSDRILSEMKKAAASISLTYPIFFGYIDLDNNEIQNIYVPKVPALLIFKKHDKIPPLSFTGEIDEANIKAFISQHLQRIEQKTDL
jgi:hypothetical protein